MSERIIELTLLTLASVVALAAAACSVSRPGSPRPHTAAAETPTISPNRPTFSDGTSLVPRDHLQIETGWTFTRRDEAGTTTERHNAPELVARYRVFDSLEARVIWGGYAWTEVEGSGAGSRDEGSTDPAVAILVPIVDQDGWRPTLVLEVASTLGIGDESVTSGHADPTVKLLWSYAGGGLPGWLSIGGNLLASYPTDGGDRFSQTAASLYASASLADSGTSFFAEWYVVSPNSNEVGAANSADIGVVQCLGRTIAVDARVGLGLDGQADDWFAGLGFSVMF